MKRGAPTSVYVAYGPDDLCLYVGVANNFRARRDGHRYTSLWCWYAQRWDVTEHPDRDAALREETRLIAELRPLFNVNKNQHPHPDPWGALTAAVTANLSPEALALRQQYAGDPDGHAAAADRFLAPAMEATRRRRAS